MKALTFTRTLAGALTSIAIVTAAATTAAQTTPASEKKSMDLGNFSVSLNVKDIKASKAFYEKLDFKVSPASSNRIGSSSRAGMRASGCSRGCSTRTS